MEEELELATIEEIQGMIYTIRGKQVMLDSDVANLYHYETKKINQAVKRNIERFPEDFCFQLTDEEYDALRSQIVTNSKSSIDNNNWSQIVTSSKSNLEDSRLQIATPSLENQNSKHRGKKYLPYVFTEQGIAMLAPLLKKQNSCSSKHKYYECICDYETFS